MGVLSLLCPPPPAPFRGLSAPIPSGPHPRPGFSSIVRDSPPYSHPHGAQDRKLRRGTGRQFMERWPQSMLSPFLSLLPTSPLLPQPLFRGAATPTLLGDWSLSWKNPRCWAGGLLPLHLGPGAEGAGRAGVQDPMVSAATTFDSPAPPHPHPQPRGPRDGGGRAAGLEDRTSSWQDIGHRPEVPSPSHGHRGKGHWDLGLTNSRTDQAPRASYSQQ